MYLSPHSALIHLVLVVLTSHVREVNSDMFSNCSGREHKFQVPAEMPRIKTFCGLPARV